MDPIIRGFSKLDKEGKINWMVKSFFHQQADIQIAAKGLLQSFWHDNEEVQKTFDEFSENTITNFYIPYGVAPNFLIDEELFCVPMAIEESSVVAAASNAAKFWLKRGGFHTQILGTKKEGQVHFFSSASFEEMQKHFPLLQERATRELSPFLEKMESRGGGLLHYKLVNKSDELESYYQIKAQFETCNAMGANFINTILEKLAAMWEEIITEKLNPAFYETNMAILSNYNPECTVLAYVECDLKDLDDKSLGMSAHRFSEKFKRAVDIARVEPYRATTHNKGIFNGIDAVILATGNDFRAIEAGGHTHAARDGHYRSLSRALIDQETFRFELEVPLALGTVGGLTALHPMAKFSLNLLKKPKAEKLMRIVAATGLAQNFAAVKSLVTTGIQKGHMKLHLFNILKTFQATEEETKKAKKYFEDKIVSYSAVEKYIKESRKRYYH